jgi:hypothetical protein
MSFSDFNLPNSLIEAVKKTINNKDDTEGKSEVETVDNEDGKKNKKEKIDINPVLTSEEVTINPPLVSKSLRKTVDLLKQSTVALSPSDSKHASRDIKIKAKKARESINDAIKLISSIDLIKEDVGSDDETLNEAKTFSLYKDQSPSQGQSLSNKATVKAFKTSDAMYAFKASSANDSNQWKETGEDNLKSGTYRVRMERGSDGKPKKTFIKEETEGDLMEARFQNLGKLAQAVWKAGDLEAKKDALKSMVEKFGATDKQKLFMQKVMKVTSPKEADKLASNLALADISMAKIKEHINPDRLPMVMESMLSEGVTSRTDGYKVISSFEKSVKKYFPKAFASALWKIGANKEYIHLHVTPNYTDRSTHGYLGFILETKQDLDKFDIVLIPDIFDKTVSDLGLKFSKITGKTPVDAMNKLIGWLKDNRNILLDNNLDESTGESVDDDPSHTKNPYKYYKKPSNRKEAQSNVNYWHYVGMASNDEIEAMGKVPATYKSYAKSMMQDARRELKKITEEVSLDEEVNYSRYPVRPSDTLTPVVDPMAEKRGIHTTDVAQDHNHEFHFGASVTNMNHGHSHEIRYGDDGSIIFYSGGKSAHTHKYGKMIKESVDEEVETKTLNEESKKSQYTSLEKTILNTINKKNRTGV